MIKFLVTPLLLQVLLVFAALPLSAGDLTANDSANVYGPHGHLIADGDDSPSTVDGTDFGTVVLPQTRRFVMRVMRIEPSPNASAWIGKVDDGSTGRSWAVPERVGMPIFGFGCVESDQVSAAGRWGMIVETRAKGLLQESWSVGDEVGFRIYFDPMGLSAGIYTATVTIFPEGGVTGFGEDYDGTVYEFAVSATVSAESADFTLSMDDDEIVPATGGAEQVVTLSGSLADPDVADVWVRFRERGTARWSAWSQLNSTLGATWSGEVRLPTGIDLDLQVVAVDALGEALHLRQVADVAIGTASDDSPSGDFGDPDGDGLANILEWALGTDPDEVTVGWGSMIEIAPGLWGVEYTRDPARDDLRVTPQAAARSAGPYHAAGVLSWIDHVDDETGLQVWHAVVPEIPSPAFYQLDVTRIADTPSGGVVTDGGGVAYEYAYIEADSHHRITVPSSTTSEAVADRVYLRDDDATTVTDYHLDVFYGNALDPDYAEWTSETPSIATVDAEGVVTHVADGLAQITAETDQGNAAILLHLSTNTGATAYEFADYAAGSAGEEFLDGMAAAAAAGTEIAIFDTQNHAGGTYVRNPDCWAVAAGLDLTGISPWNSHNGNRRAGTAITSRHIIFAAHYRINIGSTVRFVAGDGTVVDRTLIDREDVAGSDFCVGLLDSNLPASVAIYPVLPADWENYFPTPMAGGVRLGYPGQSIPMLALDQQEHAIIRDTMYLGPYVGHGASSTWSAFTETIIVGDSGNPMFFAATSGELVLLGTHYTSGGGPHAGAMVDEINAVIGNLGPEGYSLTEYDLTTFTDFSE
ncbi:MAG: Ig-like domain-containing protein [Verrucomicrobiales bacterium]